MLELCFLILSVIAQISKPSAELVVPTGTPTSEVNAEIETQPVNVEAKIIKRST